MSERNWTDEQKQAIEARKGTLLVSAAAGSGKTAVLVQRVIEHVTDTENPIDVDRLLIVTFTRAAASEMKERIGKALSEKISENPNDSRLLRQRMLLQKANICTIDSFCNELVKENFHKLGIPPNYKILENSESEILKYEAVNEVLEELYSENSPEFTELVELLSSGRDDKNLIDVILTLHSYVMAHPFFDKCIDEIGEMYRKNIPVAESEWGKTISEYTKSALDYCITVLDGTIKIIEGEPQISEAYSDSLECGRNDIESILSSAEAGEWDNTKSLIESFGFQRFKPVRGFDDVKEAVKVRRDAVKKTVQKLSEIMCATSAEHDEDIACLAPTVGKLLESVKRYDEKLKEMKLKKHAFDFSDIEHMALSLLVRPSEKGYVRTEDAVELSQHFEEILVDEYQDTNEAQDLLFRALSKDENNLFMVGDVKQSIYRFRQAMPEIFLEKRDSFPVFDGKNYPAKIILDRNFRSRQGVTGMVNYIFKQLMSKEMGEMNYDRSEELVAAAKYPKKDEEDAELHILDGGEMDEDEGRDVYEARYIAGIIKNMIDSNEKISDGGKERDIKYSDFCILLRSSAKHAPNYAAELQLCGVPAWAQIKGGFFGTNEISVMLSLLRVIDNPLQDIPLLSVMMSPIYAFTPDELADIRINDKRVSLYSSVLKKAESGDKKCADFLESLNSMRRLSATLASDELIRRIYDETGCLSMAGAMKGGKQRIANLNLLLEYAGKYESVGYRGLSGFIRFIDRVQQQKSDFSPAVSLSEKADVVRVMSIHNSKGLEFPVCIIAGCSNKFNNDSRKGNMLIHPRLGIGLKRRDMTTLRQFNTVPYKAVALESERAELSEELRVLYVAMTRAKEKLITVMTLKDPGKRLRNIANSLTDKVSFSPFAVRSACGYSDWILMGALRHLDAGMLRKLAGIDSDMILPADFRLKVCVGETKPAVNETEEEKAECKPDEKLIKLIGERVTYQYPYMSLKNVMAKSAASEMEDSKLDRENFALSRPAFMGKEGLTPAQRGTALHRFMAYSDYGSAPEDISGQIERLTEHGYISEQEGKAVDVAAVKKFFESSLAERMRRSPEVMRERRFAIMIPAGECYRDLPKETADEKILIQGVIDCAFEEDDELVIVDYKTDRVKTDEELKERYSTQLSLYKRAMNEITGLRIKECLLYSFFLGKEINMEIG